MAISKCGRDQRIFCARAEIENYGGKADRFGQRSGRGHQRLANGGIGAPVHRLDKVMGREIAGFFFFSALNVLASALKLTRGRRSGRGGCWANRRSLRKADRSSRAAEHDIIGRCPVVRSASWGRVPSILEVVNSAAIMGSPVGMARARICRQNHAQHSKSKKFRC